MTFKNPKNHKTLTTWKNYFRNLKQPIPEGELGINPADILRSPKLNILGKLILSNHHQ